jgi:ATP-dependent Lhr-like helicase
MARRWQDPRNASDLGKLDASAIARVKDEAFPAAESVDELHDALMWCGFLTSAEITPREQWADLMAELVRTQRAAQVHLPAGQVWAAAERLPRFAAIFPDLTIEPATRVPEPYASENITRENALLEIVRGRMEALGPVTAGALAESLGVDTSEIEQALLALEGEGFAMRGAFTPDFTGVEWCERRLLARIHRYTVDRLRREIEPVTSQDFMRFLCDWHHVTAQSRKDGPDALASIISDLEGFEAPAAAWETEILPARLNEYDFAWLDDLCLAGRAVWARLARPKVAEDDVRRAGPVRTTPIAILARRNVALWTAAAGSSGRAEPSMSSRARKVREYLEQHGASFFDEIIDGAGVLGAELEEALAELVALGQVGADSFAGLRALLVPADRRQSLSGARRRGRTAAFGIRDARTLVPCA